ALGHSDHFDVGELFTAGGMGALAGLLGVGVGAVAARGEVAARSALVGREVAGEVLFAPKWTMSLPGQMGQQGLTSVLTDVGFRAVQGTPVTDTGTALAQGAASGLAGRHGQARVGKVPKSLKAALDRLPKADADEGRIDPFEAVPDSGVGFSLLHGLRLEETSGGALWARPEGAGPEPWDATFASAVRTMDAGQDGPRLVVGTPDTPSGGAVRQLESVWGALRTAPRTSAALPREIVLAAPVAAHEMPALERFVATHNVGVTIPEGPSTTGGFRSWTHLEPTDPVDHTQTSPPAAAVGVPEVRPHPVEEMASGRDITEPAVSVPHASHPLAPTTPAGTVGARATSPDTAPPTNAATHHAVDTGPPVGGPGIVGGVTAVAAAGDRSTAAGPGTAAPREAAPSPGARVEGALAPKAFATVPVTTDAGVQTQLANAVQEPPAWQPVALAATGHANSPYSAEHRQLNDNLLGLPSMDKIDRTLGKLSEREYQHLMSRMDGLVAAPVLIGTDPVTTRERTVYEEDRQRVAFVLRRDGEESARNLAKNLGMAPRSGLRGGSDTYYYQSESEGDDHTGNSQMYQHYVVRDDDDLLYRNDTRHPDEIFEIGFQSRIPDSNVTLMDHVWTGPNRSQWVSTSRRDDLWRFGGYHYEIDAPGQGVDVEMTYGDDYPHLVREEEEVAFEGGIDRSFIIGADEQPIPGYGSGTFRAGEDSGSFYFVNPHFEFPVGGHQVGRNQNSDSDED
ncbi:hypothetical protein ACFVXD_33125, partial [Kitasatospora herbaricolor]